jgi:hypothetical protein
VERGGAEDKQEVYTFSEPLLVNSATLPLHTLIITEAATGMMRKPRASVHSSRLHWEGEQNKEDISYMPYIRQAAVVSRE